MVPAFYFFWFYYTLNLFFLTRTRKGNLLNPPCFRQCFHLIGIFRAFWGRMKLNTWMCEETEIKKSDFLSCNVFNQIGVFWGMDGAFVGCKKVKNDTRNNIININNAAGVEQTRGARLLLVILLMWRTWLSQKGLITLLSYVRKGNFINLVSLVSYYA